MLTAGVAGELIALETNARQPDDMTDAIAYLRTVDSETTLYVPQEAFDTGLLHPARATLERIISEVRPRLESDSGTVAFLNSRHIPASTAQLMVQAFNDDEQVTLRELIARTEGTGAEKRLMFLYESPLDANLRAKRSSLAEMDADTALKRAQVGGGSAILLDHANPALGKPVWKGKNQWVWYRF